MHYPWWHVPFLTSPMLIALVAVLHVIMSHYAVGGASPAPPARGGPGGRAAGDPDRANRPGAGPVLAADPGTAPGVTRRLALFTGLAQFGVLVLNAISRQIVQNAELSRFLDVTAEPVS
ncbi:MAG: hypothetical protein C4310_03465 [Chloroflexota bacterium]